MKRRRSAWLLLPLLLLSFCSRAKYAPTIRFPYLWLDVQGFGGDIDKQHLTEPSGICYHEARGTLFVVGDEGEVAEIRKDGTPVANTIVKGDLEAITVVPETGLLYIAVEGEDVILEFDPVRGEVTRRFPINRTFNGDPNFLQKQIDEFDNGIESMAFVPDPQHPEGGTFYIGNQWDPAMIMEVLVPLKSSRAAEAEARIIRVLPFRMDDPAAMYYDPETRLLNVVSDADNILVEITLQGKLVKEYAFLGDNQEGLCRDDEGYLYIAQDDGGIIKVKDLRRR
ncbi:MAG TPA: SdiA-regulated domain-containing protein [Candidatus Desulfaltia sp.]|nr:SdiA-regulated domain-containing protein [Candidatus Desulfaltia sp.]